MDLSDKEVEELCQTEEGVIKVIKAFEIPSIKVWVFLRPNPIINKMVENGKLAHNVVNGVNVYALTPIKPSISMNWGGTLYVEEN